MIRGSTRIVGIFGDKIDYTLSPRMHNHAFAKLGMDYVYIPFQVRPDQLKGAVEAIRSLNLAGVNVTIPHKQAVLPFLDQISPIAKKIGAVNTIINNDGKLLGDNTDAPGFLESLKEDGRIDPKKKRVLLIGAGGTARAMAISLAAAGISKLVIANRTADKAKELSVWVDKLGAKLECYPVKLSADSLKEELSDSDLLVNATPSGSDFMPSDFHRFLSPNFFVFDAVYAKNTSLVAAAKSAGVPALGGMGMLIRQGALSFSLWTGKKPPVELMREALETQ